MTTLRKVHSVGTDNPFTFTSVTKQLFAHVTKDPYEVCSRNVSKVTELVNRLVLRVRRLTPRDDW